MPNVTSLHPSEDDDDDDDDDNDDPPILSESLCIGLGVVQIAKHHSVPRNLHHTTHHWTNEPGLI